MTTLDELLEEHRLQRIGPLILQEVRLSCRRLAKKSYPPRAYAGEATWHDQALEDLAQDVITDRLLKERQIEFIVDASPDLRVFRTFLDRQVRLTLAKRRERTVIDNLIDRITAILKSGPFEIARPGRRPAYRLPNTEPELREPTDEEIRRAAAHVRLLPRVLGRGTRRAPTMYRDPQLQELVHVVFSALPTAVSVRDFDRVLREVLTEWAASVLVPYMELDNRPEDDLPVDEEPEVSEAVRALVAALDDTDRTVLAAKIAEVSDASLSEFLGVSRPTAAKRKHAISATIADHLGPLSAIGRLEAMRRLGSVAASEVP